MTLRHCSQATFAERCARRLVSIHIPERFMIECGGVT